MFMCATHIFCSLFLPREKWQVTIQKGTKIKLQVSLKRGQLSFLKQVRLFLDVLSVFLAKKQSNSSYLLPIPIEKYLCDLVA